MQTALNHSPSSPGKEHARKPFLFRRLVSLASVLEVGCSFETTATEHGCRLSTEVFLHWELSVAPQCYDNLELEKKHMLECTSRSVMIVGRSLVCCWTLSDRCESCGNTATEHCLSSGKRGEITLPISMSKFEIDFRKSGWQICSRGSCDFIQILVDSLAFWLEVVRVSVCV